MRTLLFLFLLAFIFSCGSAIETIEGVWKGKNLSITINAQEKSFDWKEKNNPDKNFSAKIVSAKMLQREKIMVQLDNKKSIKLQLFAKDTLFVYLGSGYLRLKKNQNEAGPSTLSNVMKH